jgi:hypothetical protein
MKERCALSDAPEDTMITVNSVGRIYEYNYWARDRQLEACRELSEPEFLHPMGSASRILHAVVPGRCFRVRLVLPWSAESQRHGSHRY